MNVDGLSWEYQPSENPDWAYARNLFTVLKRPQATWSQSVFSVKHENLVAPNRDFSYQGLCSFNNGYYKMLDSLFFGIRGIDLEPKNVISCPWKHTYQYSGNGIDVDVSYFLSRDIKSGITAKVLFDIRNPFMKELIIKPLVDIRNVNSFSEPEKLKTRVCGNFLTASSGKNTISFFVKDSSIISKKDVIDWRYKLGSGFRENDNGIVKFKSEYYKPVFIGELHKKIKGNEKISLLINCNRKHNDFDERDERSHANKIIKKFDCKNEIMARILSLNSFGVFEDRMSIPEAGDFWFRQVWLRDLLEMIINSFHTFDRIDNKRILKLINWIMKQQNKKTGLFANFKDNYDSADASLLFFLLAEKYFEAHEDKKMEKKVITSLRLLLNKLSENKIESNGNPAIKNNMLYCLPWHSWTDSRVDINGNLVSTRIPSDWIGKCETNKQILLPEINAMFIRLLKFGEKLGINEEVHYKDAVKEYKKVFISKDFLYSIVIDSMKDPTESSMALVSSVLLHGHAFSTNDLKKMWEAIEKLTVKRDGKLFGVLCRNLKDRVYYNDYQYHGSVVWPRDTPYLIKYLRITGKDNLVKEVLESNLEHQMKEGAIFYSNELFSLPEGINPNPTESSNNPVPVKNSIQLWSNFCDDYIN